MATHIGEPPAGLFNWKKAKRAKTGEWDIDPDDEIEITERQHSAPQRLDVRALSLHFDQHGREGTYMFKRQDHELEDGTTAMAVYIFPKYTLSYARERRRDMLAMLHLALAETTRDVEKACASAITGAYDLNRHMYLRRTFVSVHVRKNDGTTVDDHKHFIEGGGWTEHAVFVTYLRPEKKADAHPVRRGPGNSGAAKGKKVRHPKKSFVP